MELENRLVDVLGEFARTMLTDFPIQAILDRLVRRIVEVLPVTSAGVTLVSLGVSPRYVAASHPSALRYEEIQEHLGEGPCVATLTEGKAILAPDLAADGRFPGFAAEAGKAGLAAVFTFPLRHGGDQFGALDLYRESVGPLDAEAVAAAQILADVTAAYILNARTRNDLLAASVRATDAALHDALTGLPNRTLLMERLERALTRTARTGALFAVLYLDLDDFKEVNDTYGHHAGDLLLVAVADVLRATMRASDTVARLAGDEFVVLCEDVRELGYASELSARIEEALQDPLEVAGARILVRLSIGVTSPGSEPGGGAEDILRAADSAMYRAKRCRGPLESRRR
jgi:diguanylate cyclase (GGDEF)-like protein